MTSKGRVRIFIIGYISNRSLESTALFYPSIFLSIPPRSILSLSASFLLPAFSPRHSPSVLTLIHPHRPIQVQRQRSTGIGGATHPTHLFPLAILALYAVHSPGKQLARHAFADRNDALFSHTEIGTAAADEDEDGTATVVEGVGGRRVVSGVVAPTQTVKG